MEEPKNDIRLDWETHQGLLASIVQSSEDAIVSKDMHGYITSWNQSAERVLGYSESEAVGKHISLIIPENRLDEEEAIIATIFKGKKISSLKTVRRAKSGQELEVSLTVSPLYGSDGKMIGASKIIRDISSQIDLERKLLESNLALQKSNIFKDEFIGLLGHELKTPLTSLKACIELLKTIPERRDELIDKALRHANTLGSMLNEMLDTAQAQAGRLDVVPSQVNPVDFVQSAVEIVQQSCNTHSIELRDEAGSTSVMADFNRMEQVMINLLTNAIKYSPSSNKIIVTVSRMQDAVKIAVQDFGLGIPNDELDKIWTRFYRVHSHKKKIKGLGMGLHLCRQIVHLHKGTIWVESIEGEGSVFGIKLLIIERQDQVTSNNSIH